MLKKRMVGLAAGALLLTACTSVQGEDTNVSVLGEEGAQKITLEEAKEIAFNHANIDGSKALFDDEEYDQRHNEYELEFRVDNTEYEYDIDAASGKILEAEKDVDDDYKAKNKSSEKSKEEFISMNEAKQIAFEHAGVSGDNAVFDDSELDKDDRKYELEFHVDGVEYEVDIHAVTGKVLEFERDELDSHKANKQAQKSVKSEEKLTTNPKPKAENKTQEQPKQAPAQKQQSKKKVQPQQKQESKQQPKQQQKQEQPKQQPKQPKQQQSKQTNQNNGISRDQALSIAMNHIGVSRNQLSDLEIELDSDDGVKYYEIEFEVNDIEYEFDISFSNGSIIDFEVD